MSQNRYLFLAVIALIVVFIASLLFFLHSSPQATPQPKTILPTPTTTQSQSPHINPPPSEVASPLDRVLERVTKKKFGTFVSPNNSPVHPERFYGYHTGIDFETFASEADSTIPVHAVCTGPILSKQYASGYGGVVVQSCTLSGQPITVLYGHFKFSSIVPVLNSVVAQGSTLGILGKGYSSETDGERKHLHLGFHKGNSINLIGYVNSPQLLENWIDPCLYLCNN